MSNQWQARRGTTAQNDAFTGASGEITYDTESQGLRIHDGTKQGGYLVDTVVEYQKPTAENNYTWYRLYASGWVEQGGIWTGSLSAGSNSDATSTQNIPIAMADTNYCVNITNNGGTASPTVWEMWCVQQLTTTSFDIHMGAYTATRTITRMNWQVSGIAA